MARFGVGALEGRHIQQLDTAHALDLRNDVARDEVQVALRFSQGDDHVQPPLEAGDVVENRAHLVGVPRGAIDGRIHYVGWHRLRASSINARSAASRRCWCSVTQAR